MKTLGPRRLGAALLALAALPVGAQEQAAPPPAATPTTGQASAAGPWNILATKWLNLQPTGALAIDFVRYSQDAASFDQVGDLAGFEVPEVRALRAGVLGTINFDKPWRFFIAGAYRGFGQGFDREQDAAWSLFDLSLTIPVPKVGSVTVGKAKEPFSMERLMGGGVQPGLERAMGTDALTPARNAGVQFKNSVAGDRMTWGAGVFNDWLFSEEQFESGSTQVIGRLTGLPMDSPDGAGLLHLGVAGRYSNVKSGSLSFDNTPEVYSSPIFVDTQSFSAESMIHLGLEAYYQRGPLWIGAEHISVNIDSPQNGDPRFRSFFVQASWIVNGPSRPYLRNAGIFGMLLPRKSVSAGGAGLLEFGARYSMVDLDGGAIHGGEMSRLTGIANWYPSPNILVASNYGLVRLERNREVSRTYVFQLRMLLAF